MAAFLRAHARPSSKDLNEAKGRVFDLFRHACRSLPAVVDMYNIQEVVTVAQLREIAANEFRKHASVTNPQVIDLLVFKGQEELLSILDHSKQRHHLLSHYLVGPEGMVQPLKLGIVDHGESDFLKKFYISNNF